MMRFGHRSIAGTLSKPSTTRRRRLRQAAAPVVEHLENRTLLTVFLTPRADYATGFRPQALVTADFDGDGTLDLASANKYGNSVSILLNNGDGTFKDKSDYAVGAEPSSLAAGDFDGDGTMDLAVANGADNNLSILIGQGDGSFAAPVNYATGLRPRSVVAGDFDIDGATDVAVVNENSATLSVLINAGDGTFLDKMDYATATTPSSLTLSDFDHNGFADLAIACRDNAGTLNIFINATHGVFVPADDLTMGQSVSSIASADFDADGWDDLVVGLSGGNAAAVMLGNGDGTFKAKVSYGVGQSPVSVSAGDFNADGFPDLVAANRTGGTLSVLVNKKDGAFAAGGTFRPADVPLFVTTADLNGDSLADVVAANDVLGYVSVFLAMPDTAPITFPDANLEQAVRSALGKPLGTITLANMQTLTTLTAENKGITNLSGLEYAVNLTSVDLSGNGLTGFYALASLPSLTTLDLGSNQLATIQDLLGLTSLKQLDLSNNPLLSLTHLSGLTNLERLYLGSTTSSDLQPLSGLTNLAILDLGNNPISSIQPLAGLNKLQTLNLFNGQITSLAPLAGIATLSNLTVARNNLDLTAGSAAQLALAQLQGSVATLSYLPQKVQAVPAGVAATSDESALVRLTWSPALGATGYEVWRSAGDDSATAVKISPQNLALTTFDDTTTVSGTRYRYWIKAKGELATSVFSASVQGLRVPAFNADSADGNVPFLHMAGGETRTYTGQQAYAGGSGSVTVTAETLLGVATLRIDVSGYANPFGDYDNSSLWVARDAAGKFWVFKAIHKGATLSEAASLAELVPATQYLGVWPLLMSGNYTTGTTVTGIRNDVSEILSTVATLPQFPRMTFVQVRHTKADGRVDLQYYLPSQGMVLMATTVGENNDDASAVLSDFPGDLVAKGLTVTPTSLPAGGRITVTRGYEVLSFPASSNFYIHYRLSANKLWSADDLQFTTVETISQTDDKAIGLHSGSVNLTIPATVKAGTYYVLAWIDSTNLAAEVTEANNSLVFATPITVVAPANDAFTARATLVGPAVSATGFNANAGKEAGEPLHAGLTGGKSVWWKWTAPAAGRVQIDTLGSNFNTMLGIYTGTSLSALTAVAGNNNISATNTASSVVFNAVRGRSYAIAVDGYNGAVGNIKLNVSLTPGVLDNLQAVLAPSTGWRALSSGYKGSQHYSLAGKGANTAAWTFSALLAGTYRVSAVWTASSAAATNAPFSIYDGTRLLKTVAVNQKLRPVGTSYDGAIWQTLGAFRITGSTLTIKLSNNANGYVLADAVRIEKIG